MTRALVKAKKTEYWSILILLESTGPALMMIIDAREDNPGSKRKIKDPLVDQADIQNQVRRALALLNYKA